MTYSINSVLLDEMKYLQEGKGLPVLKESILLAMMTVDLKSTREDKVLYIAI